ncbi:Histidine kinase-, DNA gyrase B-, and HSP90-like ATPase [Streptomyces sp. DI166]|jgi:signal transduction histidine kinase|uniref:sensor histidine kinase n=1 Tax=Streptomyces sp. DI166 TaxID=1839783 RepID=UPI0007F481E1|nr:ATP-binding protein [Streptomyces sp. DI166]SBT91012.1 Histidine kinase-, DNA gyrase B-, and HSP90-like ATPase [Streptomyces sp. DI166]
MPDSAFPARPATGHRRRRPEIDGGTLHHARRAVALPLVLLAALLSALLPLWSVSAAGPGWVLVSLVCGLAGVTAVAARGARTVAAAVQAATEEARAAALTAVAGAAAAVEKSVQWSADELCRGERPPLPNLQASPSPSAHTEIDKALSALQAQAIASLIRVHDESQSVVLLEVLRRLAMREHALVGKALQALSQLEMLTDDPELLAKIFEIDHLVTRMRRQVESTAVLGGQSLRSVRQPVPVATALRGAVSEVVQYPRVAVAAGSVGAELGLPGHVGPDLTHLLAELIENACECSDPATKVMVRAQRVANGLAVEVEDRAIPMHPQTRVQMNRLLQAPDEVDVSGQVRAGQLGLLVAAKIAQSHGMSVLLQENVTGGTTALVVIPARLLVAIPPVDSASAPSMDTRTTVPQPQPVAAAPATPGAEQAAHSGAAGTPDAAEAHHSAAPALPTRRRQAGSFRPPGEREQAPLTAATPGLAAAFRNGYQASATAGSSPPAAEQPKP